MDILSRHFPRGTEQNHGYLTQDTRCPGRDSNRRITSARADCLQVEILTWDLSNAKYLTATFGLVAKDSLDFQGCTVEKLLLDIAYRSNY
jgi:hypothetical protein